MKYEFKPTFKVDKGSSWVFDANGNFCFQFVNYRDLKHKNMFQDTVNGISPSVGMGLYEFIPEKGTITFDGKDILLIRGWGFLTGTGGLNLSDDEAFAIQNKLGYYLTEKLNG